MKAIDLPRFKATCTELMDMERSAFETYTQAIEYYREDPLHSMLMEIRSAHDEKIDCLADHLGHYRTDPAGSPDLFSGAVEVTSMIFGEGAALMALEAGEAEAAQAYLDAASDPGLPPAFKVDLRRKVIPRVKANLLELETARLG